MSVRADKTNKQTKPPKPSLLLRHKQRSTFSGLQTRVWTIPVAIKRKCKCPVPGQNWLGFSHVPFFLILSKLLLGSSWRPQELTDWFYVLMLWWVQCINLKFLCLPKFPCRSEWGTSADITLSFWVLCGLTRTVILFLPVLLPLLTA